MARVDLQMIEGLSLPSVTGAEAALADPRLDPIFDLAWQGFVALYPGQTLQPLFDELPVEQLADLVDSVRLNGKDAPDPFVWFTLCEDEVAEAIVTALRALPMVTWADKRRPVLRPGFVSYGTICPTPRLRSRTSRSSSFGRSKSRSRWRPGAASR